MDRDSAKVLMYSLPPSHYEQIYRRSGHSFPVFSGEYLQAGSGVILDFFKNIAAPLLKQLAPHALNLTGKVISDVAGPKRLPVRRALKRRAKQALGAALKGRGARRGRAAKKGGGLIGGRRRRRRRKKRAGPGVTRARRRKSTKKGRRRKKTSKRGRRPAAKKRLSRGRKRKNKASVSFARPKFPILPKLLDE